MSRWQQYMRETQSPRPAEVLPSQEWLDAHPEGDPARTQNWQDYSEPWRPHQAGLERQEAARKSENTWKKSMERFFLKRALGPVLLRSIVFTFSAIGIALAGTLLRLYSGPGQTLKSSPIIAVIINGTALPYLIWQMADEVRGQPLGLRSPSSKMFRILTDLWFIVFESANVALAFDAVRENAESNYFQNIQLALSCVILVSLIAWLGAFAISIFRLVHRLEMRKEQSSSSDVSTVLRHRRSTLGA